MDLIQIHISEPIRTKLCKHLPFGLEETYDSYGPEILDLFDLLGPFSLGATAEAWTQDGCQRDRFPR
jgi:hypothetical protein